MVRGKRSRGGGWGGGCVEKYGAHPLGAAALGAALQAQSSPRRCTNLVSSACKDRRRPGNPSGGREPAAAPPPQAPGRREPPPSAVGGGASGWRSWVTAGESAGVARFPEVRRASALRACLPGGPERSGLARSQRPVGGARSKGLRGRGPEGGVVGSPPKSLS